MRHHVNLHQKAFSSISLVCIEHVSQKICFDFNECLKDHQGFFFLNLFF